MTEHREPIDFTAGDTLSFTRDLGDYRASAGWSLTYVLRGGAQPIQFNSTPQNDEHVILVPAATTATWLPGEYVMEGFAALADGERDRIYYGSLPIRPNLQTAPGGVAVKTFKQKVLESAERAYLKAMEHTIIESDVEGTKIVREQRKATYAAYAQAYQDRQNEIAGERSRAGLPTGNKVRPRLSIAQPGAGVATRVWGPGYAFPYGQQT